MQYQVIDNTGKPVNGVIINVAEKATGNFLYEPTYLDGSAIFEIEPYSSSEYVLVIQAAGYKKLIVDYSQLMNSNGKLVMQKQFPVALVAIALTAIYVYQHNSGKVGKLNSDDVKTIMLATGGLIGFALIKQLLEFLGIWQDREGQQLDQAATNPNSFWNPNFWRTKPDGVQWTSPLTDTEAQAVARSLYNAISVWGDDEDLINGIFRQFRAQSSVSYVAAWFLQIYKKDLLTYLRGGIPPFEGLSDSELSTINTFISKLPKY